MRALKAGGVELGGIAGDARADQEQAGSDYVPPPLYPQLAHEPTLPRRAHCQGSTTPWKAKGSILARIGSKNQVQ